MPAKPDVTVVPDIRKADTIPAPGSDDALEAAREAERLLREAAETLYAADKTAPTVQSRAAIVALRSARTAVEHMTQVYQRRASAERLTPR